MKRSLQLFYVKDQKKYVWLSFTYYHPGVSCTALLTYKISRKRLPGGYTVIYLQVSQQGSTIAVEVWLLSSPFLAPTVLSDSFCFCSGTATLPVASLHLIGHHKNKYHGKLLGIWVYSVASLYALPPVWGKQTMNTWTQGVIIHVAEVIHLGQRKSPWKLLGDMAWII